MWYERIPLIISALYLYNIVFDSIKYFRLSSEKKQKKEELYKRTVADRLILCFVSLLLLAVVIILVWQKIIPPIVSIVLIIIPYMLMHLSNALIVSDTVKKIVFEKDARKELTLDERFKLDAIIGSILLFSNYLSLEKIIHTIVSTELPSIIVSAMISFFCLVYVFILIFVFVVLMILPFRHLGILLVFIKKRISRYSKKLSLIVHKPIEKGVLDARFTNNFVDKIKSKKLVCIILLSPIVLVLFLLDFLRSILLFIYSYILCLCFEILARILKHIYNGLLNIFVSLGRVYSHKVLKDSFRLATIFSVIFVEVANRVSLFYDIDEIFIEIWEFISSGILIPVILEWIYSSNQEKKRICS